MEPALTLYLTMVLMSMVSDSAFAFLWFLGLISMVLLVDEAGKNE